MNIRENSDPRKSESERETMIRVLHLINSAATSGDLLRKVSLFLRERFGCDALGIRLREGHGFPYFVTHGFSDDFVIAETDLCETDGAGRPVLDQNGQPLLQCLCGNILRGELGGAAGPRHTGNGSLWIPSLSDLAKNGDLIEGGIKTRGRCFSEVYETLVLVPMRVGTQILGLIQVSFLEPHAVSRSTVLLLERIADNLAIAFAHRRAEEALQEAHDGLAERVKERTADLLKSNAMLTALSNAQSHYISGTDPRSLFRELLGEILTLTGSQYGFIGEVLGNEEGNPYIKLHAFSNIERNGTLPNESGEGLEFHNLHTLFGAVVTSGRPVISNDPSRDSRRGGFPEGHPPMDSFLGLPLHRRDDLVGVIGLANRAGGYDQELVGYLSPFTVCCGTLIEACRNEIGRKAAEEALRESEKRFRSIYEKSPVMMHSVDRQGNLLRVNQKWLEETGYTQEEVIGSRIGKIIPKHWFCTFQTGFSRLWREGNVKDLRLQFTKKDGTGMDVLVNSNLTVDSSGQEMSITVVENLTERARAEEQTRRSKAMLQMVFDGISDPLIMLDKDNMVRMINSAAKDYFRLPEYNDALGKPCWEALMKRPAPCEGCLRPFSSLAGFAGSFERRSHLNPDRQEQVVVYSKSGKRRGEEATIVRITDITQAKIMERQFIQNEKLASLGLLVSGIAHEINNPNSFISFNVPILRDYLETLMPMVDVHAAGLRDHDWFGMSYEEFRSDIFKLLDNMEHGSSRINRTVARLKEFARKREKSEVSPVDIRQVIEKAAALCFSEIRRKVKSFIIDVPEQIQTVTTDPEALEQVLVNLLINAAHATDKEDSWIKVSVVPCSGTLFHCVIEVRDNGCGMDEKTRQRIFDPFFTTKTASLGTGLGLYVSHSMIEGLGGKLEVESQPGQGSTFRIFLYRID